MARPREEFSNARDYQDQKTGLTPVRLTGVNLFDSTTGAFVGHLGHGIRLRDDEHFLWERVEYHSALYGAELWPRWEQSRLVEYEITLVGHSRYLSDAAEDEIWRLCQNELRPYFLQVWWVPSRQGYDFPNQPQVTVAVERDKTEAQLSYIMTLFRQVPDIKDMWGPFSKY